MTGRLPIKMEEKNKHPRMESCIAFAPWTESSLSIALRW